VHQRVYRSASQVLPHKRREEVAVDNTEAPAVLDIEIHETGTIAYGRIDTLPPVSTQSHLSAAG
jgi:hypothetical protein